VTTNIQSKFYPLTEQVDLKVKRQFWSLLAVILLHILVLLLFRYFIKSEILKLTLEDSVSPIELEIVPSYYAEVNPEAIENKPDKSQVYSFQDQQAADTSMREDNSSVPLISGSEAYASKIVSAEVVSEEDQLSLGIYKIAPNNNATMKSNSGQMDLTLTYAEAPKMSQTNPFEFEENKTGEDVLSFKNEEALISKIIGQSKIIPITKDALIATPKSVSEGDEALEKTRPIPMVRPKLSSEITKGPTMQSLVSANKFGVIALDASFSEFGEYEQQFYSALQVGWYNEVAFYKPLDTGTEVSISFIVKSDGSIHSVTVLSSSAGLIATTLCESAIIKRSPFRPWTQEMIKVFGDQKELRVRFYYR
tara:strand:+ start:1076 stop:2167 length:1092 start_codon:yes stop_codon:yes gene_type:complete